MNIKNIIIIIIVILLISAGAYYVLQNKTVDTPPVVNVPNDTKDAGESALGFTFSLPGTYTTENTGQFSRRYFKKTNETGVGQTNFIYISVIPVGKDFPAGEIYNYSKEDLLTLNSLQVNETKALGNNTNTNISQYFQYTRIEDVMVGGYGAKAYINKKPWEFPAGTTEYRYIIPFQQATFLTGAYTGTDTTSPYHISVTEFKDVLKNLRITPDTIQAVFTSPIPEGPWTTFTDSNAGVTFEYPSGWTKRTDGQSFPEGNLLTLTAIGQTQRPQTELYDGVSFAVMKPVSSGENLDTWITNRYGKTSESGEEVEYANVSYGGKTYRKAIVCGLGCFSYYHTIQNGKIYGFVVNAVGPHASAYTQTVDKIISSVVYK